MFGMGTGISSPPWPPGNNCRTKKKKKEEGTGGKADYVFGLPAVVSYELLCARMSIVSRYSTGTIIWSSLTTY